MSTLIEKSDRAAPRRRRSPGGSGGSLEQSGSEGYNPFEQLFENLPPPPTTGGSSKKNQQQQQQRMGSFDGIVGLPRHPRHIGGVLSSPAALRKKVYIGACMVLGVILLALYHGTPTQDSAGSPSSSTISLDKNQATTTTKEKKESTLRAKTQGDSIMIQKGTIPMKSPGGQSSLPYYHCGASSSATTKNNNHHQHLELILLHGAKYSKEDWKTFGLLEKLCTPSNDSNKKDDHSLLLSVTALDLSVKANAIQLNHALEALKEAQVISGINTEQSRTGNVVIVTPSASGYSMVNLGELTASSSSSSSTTITNNEETQKACNLIKQGIIRAWIAVAPGSVLNASNDGIQTFVKHSIPVLSIHGDQDAMGKKVTQRLVQLGNNAKGVEMKDAGHACYLDQPDDFVKEVKEFLQTVIQIGEEKGKEDE